ncbi:MAG TPA: sigma-70 family RNA polymerase sigma factor [Phycisphaeraceae bacterium]
MTDHRGGTTEPVPGDWGQRSDEELACQAQAGSLSAFEALVKRYQPRLARFFAHRLRGVAVDADDLTQETLVRVYQRLHQYQPAYRFKPWLYAIATRRMASACRSAKPAGVDLDHAQPVSPCDDPTAQIGREEERQRFWALVAQTVSPEQYTALWLRYVEEMPLKEVAKAMGKSSVAVRVGLHRAKAKLVHVMANQTSDAGLKPASAPSNTRLGDSPCAAG